MPAHMTANSVMASAERLIDVLHFCRNRNRIAEISVPAWPIPIQNTKLVMSHAQPIGRLLPHTPIPVETRYVSISAQHSGDGGGDRQRDPVLDAAS